MKHRFEFSSKAQSDLKIIKKLGDRNTKNKINSLLLSIDDTPFEGIGKPEPLKGNLSGVWSRRINKKDRILYEVKDEAVLIISLLGHYNI